MTVATSAAPEKPALVASVAFRGLFEVRLLLCEGGQRSVIPKEIGAALGLDADALVRRVRRQFPKGTAIMAVPSIGGEQETVTVDLRLLPAVLLGIDASRVRAELRPRIAEIQDELTNALAAYVFDGQAVNPAFASAVKAQAPRTLPAPAALLPLAELALEQLARDIDTLATAASICVGRLPPEMVEPTRLGVSWAESLLGRAERAHEDAELLQVARATHVALAARLAEIAPPSAAFAAVSVTTAALTSIDEATAALRKLCNEILLREPEGSAEAEYANYLRKYLRVGDLWKQKGGLN